jgi:hypothetical protein
MPVTGNLHDGYQPSLTAIPRRAKRRASLKGGFKYSNHKIFQREDIAREARPDGNYLAVILDEIFQLCAPPHELLCGLLQRHYFSF